MPTENFKLGARAVAALGFVLSVVFAPSVTGAETLTFVFSDEPLNAEPVNAVPDLLVTLLLAFWFC